WGSILMLNGSSPRICASSHTDVLNLARVPLSLVVTHAVAGHQPSQSNRVNRCSAPRLASTPIFGAGTLAHNGYLTPASRLMMIACTTSRATPASRTTRYPGLVTSPRDTINVVA